MLLTIEPYTGSLIQRQASDALLMLNVVMNMGSKKAKRQLTYES
jgi:hypothetical protein